MEKPIVSIIVPVFNVEKVLPQCIESILAQSFSNYELLLIDDGSNDKSGIICDEYAQHDNRIRVFHQKNQGVSKARNEGIKNSSGTFICFIDSDDYVDPEYIKRLVENTNSDTLPICGIRFINSNKEHTPEHDLLNFEEDSQSIEKEMYNIYFTGPCCKLFYKDILTNNGIEFDTSMRLSEDLHFVLRYVKYMDKIHLIPEAMYKYRDPDVTKKYKITSTELSNQLAKLNDALGILEMAKSAKFDAFRMWLNSNELAHYSNYLLSLSKYKDFKKELEYLKTNNITVRTNSPKLNLFFAIIRLNPLIGYAITKMANLYVK